MLRDKETRPASSWLSELNPAQREAVTFGEGPLLIVAGAGTGKTKTLACRVAYLIDQRIPPQRILLLTFTRRAAAEMIARARSISGCAAAGNVWGGTFHAVANRLLRIYGKAVDLPPSFTVMDQGDAADLINLIRTERGLAKKDQRFPRKDTLLRIYSHTVNAQVKLTTVLDKYFPWCSDHRSELAGLFEDYQRRKKDRFLLDYDDLLLYWRDLSADAGAGRAVADRFEHILVDEYQDTNSLQAEILVGMRRRYKNLCAVGDDAQSIYSFRAATVRNMLDFSQHFPGSRTVTLEQNYRSTRPILDACNAVMAQAREGYAKELRSDRTGRQKPILVTCADEPDQCRAVCEQLLAHLEGGIALHNQAVLFRAGHHSAQLEIELASRGIPFHKYGGLKFIETAHVKDMLALLRILENPHDELSWHRVLRLLEGIGARTAQRIMDELGINKGRMPSAAVAADGATSFLSPLRRLLSEPPTVPPGARQEFEALRAALAACSGSSPVAEGAATALPPLARQVEIIRRFYEPVFERTYPNAAVRLRDIEQLEQIAAGYRSRGRFITDLTLDPPTSTSDLAGPPFLEEDYLILSTIHSAKGCEWKVVYIIHAADGMIPSDMAVSDEAGVEEERRLFYVAMTRAKDMLYVYFPLRYYHTRHVLGDGHSYAQLTRFLPNTVRHLFEDRTHEQEGAIVEEQLLPGRAQRTDLWRD